MLGRQEQIDKRNPPQILIVYPASLATQYAGKVLAVGQQGDTLGQRTKTSRQLSFPAAFLILQDSSLTLCPIELPREDQR